MKKTKRKQKNSIISLPHLVHHYVDGIQGSLWNWYRPKVQEQELVGTPCPPPWQPPTGAPSQTTTAIDTTNVTTEGSNECTRTVAFIQ